MSCKIYVASLADYNAGTLHGTWIEDVASKGDEQVLEEVQNMLSASTQQGAEEWAIHDHDGFGTVVIGEHSAFDEVCELASLIQAHGHIPVAEATQNEEETGELSDWIADHYCGTHESPAVYAEHIFEDCYPLQTVPDALRCHIDWEGVARDMSLDGYSFVLEGPRCHVFSP